MVRKYRWVSVSLVIFSAMLICVQAIGDSMPFLSCCTTVPLIFTQTIEIATWKQHTADMGKCIISMVFREHDTE